LRVAQVAVVKVAAVVQGVTGLPQALLEQDHLLNLH